MGHSVMTGPSFDDLVRALAARDVATGAARPFPLSVDDCRVEAVIAGTYDDGTYDDGTDEWASVDLRLWHPEGAVVWQHPYADVSDLWHDLLAAHTMLEARRRSEAADLAFIVGPAPQDEPEVQP